VRVNGNQGANVGWIITIAVVLFLIPLLVRSWKYFWIISFVISLPIFIIWAQHLYISSELNQGSPGDGLGLAILLYFVTVPFFAGMLSRYVLWLAKLKTQENRFKVKKNGNHT
jgi:hypothetical protein